MAGLEALIWALRLYRKTVLGRVTFIGITGSCGKTTTKELIAAILSVRSRGRKNEGSLNTLREVARALLRARPSDDFHVQEVSVGQYHGRYTLRDRVRILQPGIAVVTNIGTDHLTMFRTPRAIAEEKGQLVAMLPVNGTAILNADDALVRGMRARFAGRILTFGTTGNPTFRGDAARSRWPERLTFTLHFENESHEVRTQLCGTHWVGSVLAAIATAYAFGVPVPAAIASVDGMPPFAGRLSPEEVKGVTFLRDDIKAPHWALPATYEFLRHATASRKILVVGTISDYPGSSSPKYRQAALEALSVADWVMFVGPGASQALPAKRSHPNQNLVTFASRGQLADHLKGFLRVGDLVLLKGSEVDGLMHVIPQLRAAWNSEDSGPPSHPEKAGPDDECSTAQFTVESPEPLLRVVVGLGNPEAKYRDSRHNIGHRVVEAVAAGMQAEWKKQRGAMVARAECCGKPVYLMKLDANMNISGPALKEMSERLAFGIHQCIVVHDDLDLPPGKVREKLSGSAGGHNGIRSILMAYQRDDFRRVKIGIGKPPDKHEVVRYVLTPFSEGEQLVIEKACAEAVSRVLTLLRQFPQ